MSVGAAGKIWTYSGSFLKWMPSELSLTQLIIHPHTLGERANPHKLNEELRGSMNRFTVTVTDYNPLTKKADQSGFLTVILAGRDLYKFTKQRCIIENC